MRISDWSSDVCSSDLAACIGRTRKEKPELQDAIAAFARTSTGLGQNLLRFAIAVVLLYFGARWVVQSAPVIGLALGLAPLLTGLLVVAIGTALPEVAAAIAAARRGQGDMVAGRSEEHTSELQSLMRTSYAVFCLKKKKRK